MNLDTAVQRAAGDVERFICRSVIKDVITVFNQQNRNQTLCLSRGIIRVIGTDNGSLIYVSTRKIKHLRRGEINKNKSTVYRNGRHPEARIICLFQTRKLTASIGKKTS